MKHITDDEFLEQYKPIQGDECTCKDFDSGSLEDWEQVIKATEEKRSWTAVDVDGHLWIISGLHLVNKFAVFITEVPHNDELIEIDWESEMDSDEEEE